MSSRRPANAAVDKFEIQSVLPQKSAVNFLVEWDHKIWIE